MALFTFIMDYRGGTYVHQAIGTDQGAATVAWVEAMALENVASLTEESLASIREAILPQTPCEVSGMRNVWCLSAVVAEHLALVHVIATES